MCVQLTKRVNKTSKILIILPNLQKRGPMGLSPWGVSPKRCRKPSKSRNASHHFSSSPLPLQAGEKRYDLSYFVWFDLVGFVLVIVGGNEKMLAHQ